MDILKQMILQMDRKEVTNYGIYAGRFSEKESRKDLDLFKMIRREGIDFKDEIAIKQLYPGQKRSAYYRLKNRLTEDINKSAFLQSYEENHNMLSLYLLSMGYYYYNKTEYRLAYYHFKKAEKKALEIENYGLLDIIYARLIRVSQELSEPNTEDFIRKRMENRQIIDKLSQLDNVLEAVEYRVKMSQNLSAIENIEEILKITVDDFASDEDLKNSSRLQTGIYQIVSRVLLQKNDFVSLEPYLVKTYNDFEEKKFFSRNNHDLKLEMISWMANAFFKNKKYTQSLEYAALLHKEMQKFDGVFYNRFEVFYYNCLVINYSVINPQKAIDTLLHLTQKENKDKMRLYGVFVYLNLALLYYQQKNYSKSLDSIIKMYKHEGYSATDKMVQLKMNLGELILRNELKENEIAEYRLKQVEKDFAEILKNEDGAWEKDFLKIYSIMIKSDNYKKSPGFVTEVNRFLEKVRNLPSRDELLFNYDTWLKEKANL